MEVALDDRLRAIIDQAVDSGRYGSANDVVREGLRLVEERETKLKQLQHTLEAALAEGGAHTDDDVARAVDDASTRLSRQGF